MYQFLVVYRENETFEGSCFIEFDHMPTGEELRVKFINMVSYRQNKVIIDAKFCWKIDKNQEEKGAS